MRRYIRWIGLLALFGTLTLVSACGDTPTQTPAAATAIPAFGQVDQDEKSKDKGLAVSFHFARVTAAGDLVSGTATSVEKSAGAGEYVVRFPGSLEGCAGVASPAFFVPGGALVSSELLAPVLFFEQRGEGSVVVQLIDERLGFVDTSFTLMLMCPS
jgi:hypothetical protein